MINDNNLSLSNECHCRANHLHDEMEEINAARRVLGPDYPNAQRVLQQRFREIRQELGELD